MAIMQKFKDIEDIYADALKSLKQDFQDGKISANEATTQTKTHKRNKRPSFCYGYHTSIQHH